MHPRLFLALIGLGAFDVGYIDFVLGPRIVESHRDGTLTPAPEREVPAPERPQPAPAAAVPATPPPVAAAPASAPAAPPAVPAAVPPAAASAPVARDPGPPGNSWWIVSFPAAGQVGLSPAAEQQLTQIAARFASSHDVRLNIVGHADARGDGALNERLGALRARAVAEALQRAGFRPDQIVIGSRGEAAPAVLGSDRDAWAANRRAEIEVITTPKSQPPGANVP